MQQQIATDVEVGVAGFFWSSGKLAPVSTVVNVAAYSCSFFLFFFLN